MIINKTNYQKSLFLALLASATLFSCHKHDDSDSLSPSVVLRGEMEDVVLTKTHMDSDNGILWSEILENGHRQSKIPAKLSLINSHSSNC